MAALPWFAESTPAAQLYEIAMTHSATLFVAYATVALLWLALSRVLPWWRSPERPAFAHPWRELGWALLAVVAVVLIGQLYVRGIRLPAQGPWRPITESLNQLAIFLPVVVLPILRRQSWTTMWLPRGRVAQRIGIGFALAAVAFAIFLIVEADAYAPSAALARLFMLGNIPIFVQVFLEDLAIAMLAARLAAAASPKWAVVVTAALFAAGHIPTMVANGVAPAEFLGLLRDVGLGVLLLSVAYRSADILWFWPVHSVLDMTQFMSQA